jgi:hypothetical protein
MDVRVARSNLSLITHIKNTMETQYIFREILAASILFLERDIGYLSPFMRII